MWAVNRWWTTTEVRTMRAMFERGCKASYIARRLGRTYNAVKAQERTQRLRGGEA